MASRSYQLEKGLDSQTIHERLTEATLNPRPEDFEFASQTYFQLDWDLKCDALQLFSLFGRRGRDRILEVLALEGNPTVRFYGLRELAMLGDPSMDGLLAKDIPPLRNHARRCLWILGRFACRTISHDKAAEYAFELETFRPNEYEWIRDALEELRSVQALGLQT